MFTNLLVRHPYFVLSAVSVFCITCLILPLTLKKLPNFSDPQLGFETRGTIIAQRLTAWNNLLEATKPSGQFAVDPRDLFAQLNNTINKKPKKKNKNNNGNGPKVIVTLNQTRHEEQHDKNNQWRQLQELSRTLKIKERNLIKSPKDGFFCGTPDQRYSRVVVKSIDDTSLFTYQSMMSICRIEHRMMENIHYSGLCDTITKNKCCHPWSIVNYVAILHNRTSCLAITEEDVSKTLTLLQFCSPFYHNLKLTHDCNKHTCQAPVQCNQHNAVFNILHYLTDIYFLPPNNNSNNNSVNKSYLKQSMIFLPIGCSTKTLNYYHYLEKKVLEHKNVKVVAMEFGLKSALFDEYLIKDTWFIFSGGICVLICMWIYTESLFLTIMTIITIVFSLGVSYFVYTLIFELSFFPFMNLLATVVVVGIGADDVFIFCKIWYTNKMEKDSSVSQLMSDTFQHAILSMFVTSLTTAAAFYSSLISSITTVCCFSVFAGSAIIANFFLMLTWLPASVVVAERWCWPTILPGHWGYCENILRSFRICIDRVWVFMQRFLLYIALKYRVFWIIFLSLVTTVSFFIVLKYPGLQLPESLEFQLFEGRHVFEKYDMEYKQLFWYERQRMDSTFSENYKLPLRFVWGIAPEDNGNYMNPYSKGTLVVDKSFDIADPESQKWLLQFCRDLRAQPFYLSTLGPLLPNCFIESFLSWMQRRCSDPMENIDRSPCCETQTFPYEKKIFEMCIIQAMSALYETPSEYLMPGVAGPKFSKSTSPKIRALVVEYDSVFSYSLSYPYMEKFYNQVEKWTLEQMKSAPPGMRKGWFISELEFYDLQRVLSQSTIHAILSALFVAFIVLLVVTLNILISIYAIYCITCSIFTTMAILILCGWKLNVLESIAISTAIGLAVDYSLHYGISYKLCKDKSDRYACARQALSSMGGSTAMAAFTTATVGLFLLPSMVLAYVQIGIFLFVVMIVSWVYSTFLFTNLLCLAGPEKDFGQFSYSCFKNCLPFNSHSCGLNKGSDEQNARSSQIQNRHKCNVLSETTLSTTSTIHAIPESESHELASLTDRNYKTKQKSQTTSNRYMTDDQSPSAASSITIILGEDN